MRRPSSSAALVAALGAIACAGVLGSESGRAYTRPGAGGSVPPASYVAYARGRSVAVYDSERSSRPRLTLSNPTDGGTLLSFLVRSLRRPRALVYLPNRPNGSTGWIDRSQVRVYTTAYRVRIELGSHRLTVWRSGRVVDRQPIGVGRAVTPTPPGTYYIVSRIRPFDPNSVYGAFAFGLSAHSNVFARFGFGGDGRIGLHGTNDPAGVGHDVSHGCIRMTNRSILRLSRLLALGTPIVIAR